MAVDTIGDGNCLFRAVSLAIFGSERNYNELRLRYVCEATKNRDRYLDDAYLDIGLKEVMNGSSSARIAQFSMSYKLNAIGPLKERVEDIYENEVFQSRKNTTWSGVWQIIGLANVLCRPILSIYPKRSGNLRPDFHRLFVPFDEKFRSEEPIIIMWTPCSHNGIPEHFVPLLKLDCKTNKMLNLHCECLQLVYCYWY